MNNVFISYVRNDQAAVDRLAAELRREGLHVWLDRDDILPGQFWEETLHTAIRNGAFFLACFSEAYQSRDTTYMKEELRVACEQSLSREQNPGWLIPVLLSPCEIPAMQVSQNLTLKDVQWIDLSNDWKEGIWKLLQVVRPSTSYSHETDLWYRGLCETHIKSVIDRAYSMRAFRVREVEDAWRSLLLPSRWGPTLDIIVRLFKKVRERKMPLTERWIEPTDEGITILTTVSPTASSSAILKSLSKRFFSFSNPYEDFIRRERKILREAVNWQKRDLAHWIFAVDGNDLTVDLMYWINTNLALELIGWRLERQGTDQQMIGPLENAYPGSIFTVTEFEKLQNKIMREEALLEK